MIFFMNHPSTIYCARAISAAHLSGQNLISIYKVKKGQKAKNTERFRHQCQKRSVFFAFFCFFAVNLSENYGWKILSSTKYLLVTL